MTLSLACLTSSGIVLSTDSRQTYRNKVNMTRIGTDSALKLFQITPAIGVVIAGRAFFPDGNGILKNTGWFIEEFRKTELPPNGSVREISVALNNYFTRAFLEPEVLRVRERLELNVIAQGGRDLTFKSRDRLKIPYSYIGKDGNYVESQWLIDSISYIVAGYDPDGTGRGCVNFVPDGPTREQNTEYGGALWIGQSDILGRIIKGYAWEINDLDFVKEARSQGKAIDSELAKLEYVINWATMTIQDAVDFCVLMTRMTEGIQRFSDGTTMNPGGIPGVGGHVNVATITSDEGLRWINKRDLVVDSS
jgi:20S proteasome alpha/beta subunit